LGLPDRWGLILLEALDSQLELSARLPACLDEARQAGTVLHEAIELNPSTRASTPQ
jgi:hypothetical protein